MHIIKDGSGSEPLLRIFIITMMILVLASVAIISLLYLYKPTIFSEMSEHSLDWLRDKAIGWSHTPPVNKIDTHHHCVPSFYAKGKILISDYSSKSLTV